MDTKTCEVRVIWQNGRRNYVIDIDYHTSIADVRYFEAQRLGCNPSEVEVEFVN